MLLLRLLKQYITSPTHQWWVKNVWKPSWTRFVSLVYGIPSAVLAILAYADKLASDDKIQTLMDKLHIPDGVFATLAFLALIHYIAHGRDDD